jgi:positive regulator of sigma E activity
LSSPSAARMHLTRGRIIEVRNSRAIIELDVEPSQVGKQESCSGCGLCNAVGGGQVELRANCDPKTSLKSGDRVEVEIRLVNPGKAGILLYGMPLLSFLGFGWGAWWITGSEGAMIGSAFAAMCSFYLLLFLIEAKRGARARVIRKLS